MLRASGIFLLSQSLAQCFVAGNVEGKQHSCFRAGKAEFSLLSNNTREINR